MRVIRNLLIYVMLVLCACRNKNLLTPVTQKLSGCGGVELFLFVKANVGSLTELLLTFTVRISQATVQDGSVSEAERRVV